MRPEHRQIQEWVKEHYSSKYRVSPEIDAQNRLPDSPRRWYQPDIILRNAHSEVEYILEIECDPVRKALVGASILAEASIHALDQRVRPTLVFVVYGAKGIEQIENFRTRIDIIKPYCHALRDIQVMSWCDFKALDL